MENGKPVYLVDVMEVAQQAALQDCSRERRHAEGVQPDLLGTSYAVGSRGADHETSAAFYEGVAGLRW